MPEPLKPSPESSEQPASAAARVSAQSLATSVTAYLISGPVVFGGGGWMLDKWLGTGFFVVVGLLAGMAMSLYVILLRYGTE